MIPVLAAAGYTLWRFGPQRSYTARQLGLTDLQSPNDADGDGVCDNAGYGAYGAGRGAHRGR